MKTLIVQNLVHRGTVGAEGFLFSAKILPESEMRRRVLALWQPEAKIFRHGEDLILIFSKSFRVDCRRAPAFPLVRYGEVLSTFPLRKGDAEIFREAGAAIIFLQAGRLEKILVHELAAEKLEAWLDTSGFQIVETETLGEIKTKPVFVEKTETIDLREELGNVPEADAEMKEILQILQRKKDEITKAGSGQIFTGENSSSLISGSFGGFFDALKNLFSSKAEQTWRDSYESFPKPPGRLRQIFMKALFQMKIAQIMGRRQAQYLAKMMEMFESGDLENALKHAIPLENMQALKEVSAQTPFLGFLRPRRDLQINYGRQTGSSSAVFLEDEWFTNLRQLYRQTFERLKAQNRIEEAAFVLAELLNSNAEAVEFLEKHGEFRLAAQLAESRDLPKETIVRQWFLAGEKRRAVQLAVLHNCFEYVVTRLEQERHPQAAVLREVWAENLAASGNFTAAINTIWKLENKRALAEKWIDEAIEFGGAPAAEMMAKKIVLFPESFDQIKTLLMEILAETDTDSAEKRAAFARETLRLAPNAELRALIPPLARKLLADTAKDGRSFSSQDFRQLVEMSQDYTLRTDLPKLPESAENSTLETFRLEISERDRGAARISDACLLPDGKVAVALGAAGVKILTRQGKPIVHFDQPTQKFIVSDFGTKAICLAQRGEVWRLAKIDFVERKAAYWCDAQFKTYAPTFDGNLWFVAEKDEIYAIDTNAKTFEAVWRVTEMDGQIYEISRTKNKLMLLTMGDKGAEKWWYDLPQFILRSRNQPKRFALNNENQFVHSAASFIAYSVVQIAEITEQGRNFEVRIFDYDAEIAKFTLSDETLGIEKPQIVEKTYSLLYATEKNFVINLYEIPKKHLAEFVISRSEEISVRLDEKFLTITDAFGRVVIFDYKAGLLRKNLRF
jgi:hypothetical protein